MNEKETKKLVQKSTIQTSDDFTDRLMLLIADKVVQKRPFRWPGPLLVSCALGALVLVGFLVLIISNRSSGLLQPPVLAAAGFAFLWLLRYLLQLRENYRQLVGNGPM